MEMMKKWGLPFLLIVVGLVLLVSGLLGQTGPWVLLGATLTMLAGACALLLTLRLLDQRKGLMLGVALLVATLLLGWRNVRSISRTTKFTQDLEAHDQEVIQSLKDIRTVQLGYRQTHGHFTAEVETLRHFVAHGHVPVVFLSSGGTPGTEASVHDTAWVPAREQLFGLATAQQDRCFPFDPATFATVPGTGRSFILRAGTIDRDGMEVSVFEARDPEPWTTDDTLAVGSLKSASLEGNWTGR